MAATTRAASARRKVSVSMHPTAAAAYSAPPLPPRLGEGGFGTVFSCKLDGRDAVAKQIGKARLGAKDLPLLQNEVRLWAQLDHPNCIKFFGVIIDSSYFYLLCANPSPNQSPNPSTSFSHLLSSLLCASLAHAALRRWRGWARAQAEPPRSLPPGASSLYLPMSPCISRQVRAHARRLAARQAREAAQAVQGGPDPVPADGGAAGRDAADRGRDGAPAPQEDPAPRPQVGQRPLRRPPVSTRASCGLRTVAASSVVLRVRARRTRLPRAMVPKAQGSLP